MQLLKVYYKILAMVVYPFQFNSFGRKSRIDSPLQIDGKRHICIGDDVLIMSQTWLACVPLGTCKQPELKIGTGSRIGHFNHIYAIQSIVLESNVLTADKVYITDNLHTYDDVESPIRKQPIKHTNPVIIGEGSWLGENVCIIGASVGKQCVIGANSVVTHDIPDYSVAVGVPAKVIKRYNFETKIWEKI